MANAPPLDVPRVQVVAFALYTHDRSVLKLTAQLYPLKPGEPREARLEFQRDLGCYGSTFYETPHVDRLAAETAKFIEANKDRPFFAYFSFYSVHTPLMAREDLRKKYEEKRRRLGLEAMWDREGERDVRLVQEHAVYAGMVEAMDLAVGKVLVKLDELGLRENTIVVFTSDNGGLSTSEGWPTSNLPLRGGKGWLYEGSIREPLVIRWPAVVKAGTVISSPVSNAAYDPTKPSGRAARRPESAVPAPKLPIPSLLRFMTVRC